MLTDQSDYFFASRPVGAARSLPLFHLGHRVGSQVIMNYPDAITAWEWADITHSISAATVDDARTQYRALYL